MAEPISDEMLTAYLEDSLSAAETARVEAALRQSESLRRSLRAIMERLDRGEHSIGAVWRRNRLSCPSRDELGSFLLRALDTARYDYIEFHLKVIGCPYCEANLVDLEAQQQEAASTTRQRRKRIYESGAGMINADKRRRS